MNRLVALLTLILGVASGSLAGQGAVTIPGSEQYLMKSATNGIEYQVNVALPSGYQTSGKRYPVFYVLDANLVFATLVDIYRGLRIDTSVPEMIVVGIGYPEDDPAVYTPAYHASRSGDYTPTNVEAALPGSGGARRFLTYLKDELIPLIDGRYRTDPTDRGLGGHSLSGLFTTYALLTEPATFGRYWIGSPAFWWDSLSIFGSVGAARARTDQPKGRAFLTVGSLETDVMVPPMQRMAVRLKAGFPALEVSSIVYPNETHMSVLGGAISRALRVLYARRTVPISLADAAAVAGRWKAPSGEAITIRAKGAKLTLAMAVLGNTLTIDLAAEEKDRYFGTTLSLELAAERDPAGRVIRLRRNFMNGEIVFERSR